MRSSQTTDLARSHLLAGSLDEALQIGARNPSASIHLTAASWHDVDCARATLAAQGLAHRIHVHHHSAVPALQRVLQRSA